MTTTTATTNGVGTTTVTTGADFSFHYYDEDLPWGAAYIPEWWSELTPHHTLDFNEIDQERRRDMAHMASLRERYGGSPELLQASSTSPSQLLLADTAAGPYSLPCFQASDGIADASFVAPDQQTWNITPDGFFYNSTENPEVRYTAAQMVESGHLPPGMDQYFVPGWDKARNTGATSPMYARTEEHQWEKPDWLKKRLRSTDQGVAMRHGMHELAESQVRPKSPARRRSPESTATPSSPMRSSSQAAPTVQLSPVKSRPQLNSTTSPQSTNKPAWQLKREQILKNKAAEEEIVTTSTKEAVGPPKLEEQSKSGSGVAVGLVAGVAAGVGAAAVATSADDNEKEEETEETLSASKSASTAKEAKATSDETTTVVPAWKMQQQETATSSSSSSVPAWKKKLPQPQQESKPENTATTHTPAVPAWKKKQPEATNAASYTTPSAASSSSVPAWKKKQEEESVASSTANLSSPAAAAATEPASTSGHRAVAAASTSTPAAMTQPAPVMSAPIPPAGTFVPVSEDTPAASVSTAATTSEPAPEVPAWKKKLQENRAQATAASNNSVPAWKKKQQEASTTNQSDNAIPAWKQKNALEKSTNTKPQEPVKTPEWKKPQQEQQEEPQPPATTTTEPEAGDETQEAADVTELTEGEEEDAQTTQLISQGLVLKLMALPDDASRAKELRNTIAATPENNHEVMVPPSELLVAIAHHAQTWKKQGESRDKIHSLRQVAIIARLVIMKLYGSHSPELKQFEEGLRPAFT